jgi:hypothetical protein
MWCPNHCEDWPGSFRVFGPNWEPPSGEIGGCEGDLMEGNWCHWCLVVCSARCRRNRRLALIEDGQAHREVIRRILRDRKKHPYYTLSNFGTVSQTLSNWNRVHTRAAKLRQIAVSEVVITPIQLSTIRQQNIPRPNTVIMPLTTL